MSQYNVCQFFIDDSHEYVARNVGAEEALRVAAQLCRSVGGQLGTTKRVIITDPGDMINWEWEHGKGITYPPQLAGRQL
jgi:hypothetical protein